MISVQFYIQRSLHIFGEISIGDIEDIEIKKLPGNLSASLSTAILI